MAQRRMFNKAITNSDTFLELPDSSQILYFHLSMNADDDGFVDNWKSIMRMTGTKEDDLKILIAKSFVIPFDTGVIVIKHWRLNNYLQTDRKLATIHQEELKKLEISKNGQYFLKKPINTGIDGFCIHSIDKYSIEENSINIYSAKERLINNTKELEKEFEEVWLTYPNKIGKKNALNSYIKARRDKNVGKETILQGIEKYKKYCEANKDWYRPKNGSTWFNQESWEDDYKNDLKKGIDWEKAIADAKKYDEEKRKVDEQRRSS